jgi:hypothetical protein
MSGIAASSTVGQTVHLSPALVQPIASDDVAAAMADVAVGAPLNGTVEVGRSRAATSRRTRPTTLERQPRRTSSDYGRPRTQLRRRAERSIPHPWRWRTRRADPLRGMGQAVHDPQVARSGAAVRCVGLLQDRRVGRTHSLTNKPHNVRNRDTPAGVTNLRR